MNVPSGNNPLFPFTKWRPKNHPSPNSSSRSINSTRSPLARLSSSELLAWKSSTTTATFISARERRCRTWGTTATSRLTDDDQNITHVRAHIGRLPRCHCGLRTTPRSGRVGGEVARRWDEEDGEQNFGSWGGRLATWGVVWTPTWLQYRI